MFTVPFSKQQTLTTIQGPIAPAGDSALAAGCVGKDSQRSADKAGMPHQHVPVADNAEATGGLSEATKPLLARLGRVLLLTFLARARKVRRPPVREPATSNHETECN